MLGGSKIYWHYADRVLHPIEYFFINGWDDDISVADIHRPPSPELSALLSPTSSSCHPDAQQPRPQKRTRTMPNKGPTGRGHLPFASKCVDLAGNAMTMPDLASILIPCIYASQPVGDPLFEGQPGDVEDFPAQGGKQQSFDLMLPDQELVSLLVTTTDVVEEDGVDGDDVDELSE